jgi:hypothetical protein
MEETPEEQRPGIETVSDLDTKLIKDTMRLEKSFFLSLVPFEKASLEWCRGNSKRMGEPSEREALLTLLLNMPARECFEVILLWGAKELVVLFYQLKAGRIYTYGLFVHVSMHM